MNNYTVIARRWRPKRFEDVIGQSHITTTIRNSIKYGRIPHAFLFTGPRGVGKTSLARIIAKAVNCMNGPTEEPCDVCENCRAINGGTFTDVIEIDAASTRKIEDIRELRETVKYMPMKGRYKVYILDEAHQLTGDAKDAFLKTLEEPPGHNIFILATTEVQKIPYTIMSRCQRFDFKRISERDIIGQLERICREENIGYEKEVFQHVASEADGSMRDAESILDQVIAYCGDPITTKDAVNAIGVIEKEILFGIVKSVFDDDMRKGIEIIDDTLNRGYDVYQVYKGLMNLLRHMMIIKICNERPQFISMGDLDYARVQEIIGDVEYYEIQNMLYYLLRSENFLRGPFPKVSLEVLYVNLCNLSKLRNIEKVLDSTRKTRHVQDEARYPIIAEEVHAAPSPVEQYPASSTEQKYPDLKGFLVFLKEKTPFIGNIFENLDVKMERNDVTIFLGKDYNFIKEGENLKEIKRYFLEYFGKQMDLIVKEGGKNKQDILEDYIREAETLFRI